jgi:hypothetical protein
MVTDAVWSDVDMDGQSDLIVVGNWMPVMVFKNEDGSLKDWTDKAGLANTHGWWNRICTEDLDADGDPDFILGNHGLNSKLTASYEMPLTMYVGDFDANDQFDQILCTRKGDNDVPFAMLSELREQMPGIAQVIPTYNAYSEVDGIEDILNERQLENAYVQKSYILASSWLENLGDGSFTLHPLPLQAQFSPVYGIVAEDFDRDERIDLLIGGNFNNASINYGPYDAGLGLLLKGDGKGRFQPLEPYESGIAVRGEIRDCVVLKKRNGASMLLISRNNDSLLTYQTVQ